MNHIFSTKVITKILNGHFEIGLSNFLVGLGLLPVLHKLGIYLSGTCTACTLATSRENFIQKPETVLVT